VAQSLAKAALASSIASVAANNILIVSSYGSGSGARRCWASLYMWRESGCKRIWSTARVAPASPARPLLRQGPAALQPSPPVAPAPPAATPAPNTARRRTSGPASASDTLGRS